MSTQNKSYPGKIMLFGEYSIICGSKALVIPYDKVSGCWEYQAADNSIPASVKDSQNGLRKLLHYLVSNESTSNIIDLQSFTRDIESGLYFSSNIPQQYGLGSSGALVAAIYERYKWHEEHNLVQLKVNLALIESAFHGNSSGIDPLCCYLNEAVYIDQNGTPKTIQLYNTPKLSVFLIDTGISSSTEPLVSFFREKLLHYSFYKKFSNLYIPLVNNAIEDFIHQNSSALLKKMETINSFQFDAFDKMIPDSMQSFFKPVSSRPFQLKICGSGGGGYLLGFTDKMEETKLYFDPYKLPLLFL